MSASKSELRAKVRSRRALRTVADLESDRDKLAAALLSLCVNLQVRTLAAFLPTATEPPIDGFLQEAMRTGVTVLVPISQPDASMIWTALSPNIVVTNSPLGIPEPRIDKDAVTLRTEALEAVDLILVPAASIDSRGTRLGWGKGYYDRALETLNGRVASVAVVFEDEFVSELPAESHDQPVNGVVTPSGTHLF